MKLLSGLLERAYLWRRKREIENLRRVMVVYALVFVVWGVYRLMFRLPVWVEEVVIKSLVFGGPVLVATLVREKRSLESLGMRMKGLHLSVYFGLLFGLWLAVFAHLMVFVKTGVGVSMNLDAARFGEIALLGLVTAFWEELLFMGYMLPRVVKSLADAWVGVFLVALLFALLHVPIQLADGVAVDQLVVRTLLLFTLGFGNGVLYLKFENLAAPVFAHLAWGSVIYLFGF